ncbi:hypothetical protein DFH29DRAFT_1004600 [Suillus ampliporus]|nr:hypothetical protein DFH29DRAFT_1004600 [Suillus ampliporus]
MGDFVGGHTQGTGTISWIWLATGVDTGRSKNDRVQDCVHIEWCKARAHAARWSEEANWWCERANLRVLEKPSDQEGLQAYAYRQAALHCAMRGSFQALWSAVPQLVESTLIPEVSELNDIHTPSIDCPPDLHDEPPYDEDCV